MDRNSVNSANSEKSDKSLEHKIRVKVKILSVTCACLALWWHAGFSHRGSRFEYSFLQEYATNSIHYVDSKTIYRGKNQLVLLHFILTSVALTSFLSISTQSRQIKDSALLSKGSWNQYAAHLKGQSELLNNGNIVLEVQLIHMVVFHPTINRDGKHSFSDRNINA